MSDSTATVPRERRLRLIRQVLERWGRLRKEQLDEHVSALSGQENDTNFKRNLYRDLEFLVAEREIVEHRLSRDGVVIEDYDSELHKNTRIEWSLSSKTEQIIGEGLLEQFKASFFAPKNLLSEFQLEISRQDDTTNNFVKIFFMLGNKFLCLKAKTDAIPFKLIIGRIPKEEKSIPELKQLESKWGKRIALLLIPSPTISSPKNDEKPGHFSIEIKPNNDVLVMDLDSTNGTRISKINKEQARSLIKNGVLVDSKTVKSGRLTNFGAEHADLVPLIRHEVKTPLLIHASDEDAFLIT